MSTISAILIGFGTTFLGVLLGHLITVVSLNARKGDHE